MIVLNALLVLSAIGIGVVFWLLKNDPEKDQDGNTDENKPETAQASAESPPKFTLLRKKQDTTSEATPMPKLKEYSASEKKDTGEAIQDESIAQYQQTPSGTASIKTTPVETPSEEEVISKEEEENIRKEIELSSELSELKDKYDKLEALFSEKSTEFEKTKKSLDHELENRKEFNKVKDLLEKELKESKDKARNAQGELNNAQTENENQKKRTEQLEEKSNKLEKDLLKKEDKIDDLVKRMQAFASPSTAAIPPQIEEKGEEVKTEETPQKDQTSSRDEPTQKGGFKLDLAINQDPPEKSEKEDFLKLQPDVFSGESQETESKEEPKDSSQPPPEDTSGDQKPNP